MSIDTLIVDDSEMFRAILRTRFENIGLRIVAEAATPSEGAKLFRALRPKLVTLDLVMPDPQLYSATDLFETIRAESPDTAIIVISAHPRGPHGKNLFLAEGAIAYLQKSFMDFEEVRRRLKQICPGQLA